MRGRGKSPPGTEEKTSPYLGEANWHLDSHRANTKGRWGGSGSASPPNPPRALVLHPEVGRAGGLAVAPGGDLEERVLPRVLFPNWIPSASSYRLPSCSERTPSPHIPASYTQLTQGTGRATHAKPRQPMAQASSSAPHFGLPVLPVSGLKLGLWSLPLAWMPPLPGSRGRKLPRAQEASRCFEQAAP